MKSSIVISIILSIILHIAIFSTYPALNLRGRREHQEKVTISFMELPGEKFSVIGEKLSAGGHARLNHLKDSKVWESLWSEIDIEFLPEPEDISSFLKNEDEGLPGMEIHEKETLPLTEELEDSNGK